MLKFNRVYSLKVEADDGSDTAVPLAQRANKNVEITLPNTIEFTVLRQALGSSQTATFRIYNLAENVRNALQKDLSQVQQLRAIQFRCGYETSTSATLPLVFNGTVLIALSYREKTDWITEIEAYDGGWQMANANNVAQTLGPGASAASIIAELARRLLGTSGAPIVGDFPTINKRGEVLFGNVWSLIQQKSNGLAFIDNGQVKALNYHEVFIGQVPLLSAESGLLGSPKRTKTSLEFDLIFEPRLSVGQIVELRSSSNTQFNRKWKVMGFEHKGTVSPVTCGESITSVKLWLTDKQLTIVQGLSAV